MGSTNRRRSLDARADAALLTLLVPILAAAPVSEIYRERIPWLAATARTAFFVLLAALFVYTSLLMRKQKELERLVLLEAASISLCAVLLTALGYAALGEFKVIGKPSAWVFWNVGVLAWSIARVVITRLRT
jgi:hypothetical protein